MAAGGGRSPPRGRGPSRRAFNPSGLRAVTRMRWLLVGGGAREHAIAAPLVRAGAEVVVASPNANPGLERLARSSARVEPIDTERIVAVRAKGARGRRRHRPGGAPRERGRRRASGPPTFPPWGPGAPRPRSNPRSCSAGSFSARHGVPGRPGSSPRPRPRRSTAPSWSSARPWVVKPSGLTAGKGVWVQGTDFAEPKEGAIYAKTLLVQGDRVLLEEKLEGEEFSLMAFVTDSGVYPMPAVQDFKRALEGDTGGNTGGMGSYSQRDHLLPFLSAVGPGRRGRLSRADRGRAAVGGALFPWDPVRRVHADRGGSPPPRVQRTVRRPRGDQRPRRCTRRGTSPTSSSAWRRAASTRTSCGSVGVRPS